MRSHSSRLILCGHSREALNQQPVHRFERQHSVDLANVVTPAGHVVLAEIEKGAVPVGDAVVRASLRTSLTYPRSSFRNHRR